MYWRVPKIWEGGDAWIIGGGPSIPKLFGIPDETINKVLNGELTESAYAPYMSAIHDKHVVGINAAFLLGDWIDVVFFGDSKFFLRFEKELLGFDKLKVSCAKTAFNKNWVRSLRRDSKHGKGISTDPTAVGWNKNGNSGCAAISMVANMGAKRIFLLGFDMQLDDSKSQHWHSRYKKTRTAKNDPNRKKLPFYKHLPVFPAIARDAERLGLEIYNVSPDSAIKELPKIGLEEALRMTNSTKTVIENKEEYGKYDILSLFHEILNPQLYMEIGVREGDSLKLAQCHSIGIDVISCKRSIKDNEFYKMTSDEFFDKNLLNERVPDFVFIDGQHNFDQVIKDFCNVEKNSTRDTVVLLDDVLPFNKKQTVRKNPNNNEPWAGDVWKVIPILKKYRSDLEITLIDNKSTGFAVITNLNPKDGAFIKKHDEIISDWMNVDLPDLSSLKENVVKNKDVQWYIRNVLFHHRTKRKVYRE